MIKFGRKWFIHNSYNPLSYEYGLWLMHRHGKINYEVVWHFDSSILCCKCQKSPPEGARAVFNLIIGVQD